MNTVIGIDVSKAKLDGVWLRDPQTLKIKSKVFTNDAQGHQMVMAWIIRVTQAAPADCLVVMEATGVYHENLAHTLVEHGFRVAVVNPAQVKAYGQSLGVIHKTDHRDSLLLARYGHSQHPPAWQPEAREIRELKALIARFNALDTDHRRESNRLEKAEFNRASRTVIQSIQQMIQILQAEKQRLEQEIDDHIDRHPTLKHDRALLESIPGIGPILSRLMLSVIHSRSFQRAGQLAAYLGVIPVQVESGTYKGRSALSKKGPSTVRAKLYMAAIVASQHNPDVIRQRARLLANGKTKMQALGAAMRKLVHLCFGVIKQQTVYVPQTT